MKPAQYDFLMQRGTFGQRGAIVFQCCEADGTPMNLVGATITLATTNLKPVNITKSTTDGTLTVDSFSNVSWQPTAAEVVSIPLGRWTRYYVEIVYPDGTDGLRFLEGYLIGLGA